MLEVAVGAAAGAEWCQRTAGVQVLLVVVRDDAETTAQQVRASFQLRLDGVQLVDALLQRRDLVQLARPTLPRGQPVPLALLHQLPIKSKFTVKMRRKRTP